MSEFLSSPSAIVAADPTRPFAPRPLVADIVRTRYCIPDSIFLVEGIDTHVPVSKRYRTVRLLLGDGDLCIQALLRKEMHPFVDSAQVYVGCYVRLNQFEIRFLSRSDGPDGEASGTSQTAFLVVQDMVTVGWNTAYTDMAGTGTEDADPVTPIAADTREVETTKAPAEDHIKPQEDGARVQRLSSKKVVDSDVEDGFEVMEVSEQKAIERRQQLQRATYAGPGLGSSANLPWISDDLSKPLKLTALGSIPNLPYKQNWIVNVLAVIVSVSDLEPTFLPPFKQRTVRLADPSTTKQVLLTVFLDAEDFKPDIGSVVLLIGVKNHRFDGGCLKKYGNERRKNDSRWWFENPEELEWCDVAGLTQWWETKDR